MESVEDKFEGSFDASKSRRYFRGELPARGEHGDQDSDSLDNYQAIIHLAAAAGEDCRVSVAGTSRKIDIGNGEHV